MKFRFLIASVLLFAAACGSDGSGVDGDKRISALSTSEQKTLCEWQADELDAPREVSCGDGRSIGFHDAATCERAFDRLSSKCAFTVDQYESCIEALADEPCSKPDVCKVVLSCG